ncbi:phage terminase small subunit P27 family [Bradyrhizobium sp. BRP22]|uniref:phage terminase small subunit P27 family n=1 Tax=Bradyrhizobium sp. BRP22 TaxID=2793821 RepID=UPI001CD37109|nr:phage terminase small subunit P27 family [Bradyrhizobium sp. BRP22]MCA1452153.1 phage terminase small subunit P27 family [Bradyrhizobium sp. BRP22]
MQRGAKPKPTALKLLRGVPGHHALPKGELHPLREETCPPPPHNIRHKADAREEWNRIAPELHRLGLLTIADYRPLSLYCLAYARWCDAEAALDEMAKDDPRFHALVVEGAMGGKVANPLVKIAATAGLHVMRYAVEFGFTPSSRTRISGTASGDEPKSKFDGLLAANE